MANRYIEALGRVPAGETRSFMELAALAGRPGAARVAGRAVRACPVNTPVPWHRVVAASGALIDDAHRGRLQLSRLRREGARPRDGESVSAWSRRCSVAYVGKLPDRIFVPADDPRIERWPVLQVEPLSDENAALVRGFRPADGTAVLRYGDARRQRLERPARTAATSLESRLDRLDWHTARETLAACGCWVAPRLLAPAESDAIVGASTAGDPFDRGVDMLAKGYGVGRYRYWKEPLPAPLGALRETLYCRLRPLADAFRSTAYPATLAGFWRECRAAGQRRPSSILIQYPTRGVNHPHRDVYGKIWFPFQALVVLSRAGRDFEGGDFVLIEERSAGDRRREVPVDEGDVVVFGTRTRHEKKDGRRRSVPLLHAMDPVTRGEREAVGLVFHLAE